MTMMRVVVLLFREGLQNDLVIVFPVLLIPELVFADRILFIPPQFCRARPQLLLHDSAYLIHLRSQVVVAPPG